MDPSDHGGRFIITKKNSTVKDLLPRSRYSKSWDKVKDPVIPLERNVHGPIGRIANYIIGKRRKESICTEMFLIHSEKGALSLSLCTWTIWRWEVKWIWNLCIFGVKHFALKEITPLFDQMGCASRECKQNVKICVCDILRHNQKVFRKRKIWFRKHGMLLQHGRTERLKGRCPLIRLIYQFRTYVNPNITSR